MIDHALIVDDSKTARMVLRQLLQKKNFQVDMVESAESALDFLEQVRPKVIFMDHMMPGMNGFQAVKAIKSNSKISDIPIVMYTSREGEMYLGQARALGATDILAKPATIDDVEELLLRLEEHHVLAGAVAEAEQLPIASVTSLSSRREARQVDRPSTLSAVNSASVSSTRYDYDSLSEEAAPAAAKGSEHDDVSRRQSISGLRPSIAALLIIIPVIWLLALYVPAQRHNQRLLEERRVLLKTIQWAANQSGQYGYAETPLGGGRLTLLKGLVAQLAAAKFTGRVVLNSHVGEYCLQEASNNRSGWILLDGNLPLSDCDAIGQSPLQSVSMSSRQTSEFKDFIENSPLLQSSGIAIDVIAFGATKPAFSYPEDVDLATAGDWNYIAALNNRVEFEIRPSAVEKPDTRKAGN